MKPAISFSRSHWFGFGVRAHWSRGDLLSLVVRFAWWRAWFEWEIG